MKKNYFFYFLLFSSSISLAQKENDSLVSPFIQYEKDLYKEGVKRTFNDKMLNVLFANKVGTSFGSSNDLTLQKFYTSLDVNDNSLAIGANFDTRGDDETKKLTWLLSAGAKIKADNKFATIYDNGDFQENNIGLTFKITLIGNGIINFTEKKITGKEIDRKAAIETYRKEILAPKYSAKTHKYNKEELKASYTYYKALKDLDNDIEDIDETIKNKHDALYIELAKEEISYIEKNKMYRFLWDHWHSLDLFIPLGENTYLVTDDVVNTSLQKKNFYAFTATYSGNTAIQFSSGESIFLKGKISLKNNNNILVDNLQTTAFQTTTTGAGGTTVVTSSKNGYTTAYKQFLTPSLLIEPAFFTLNNSIGFSPAIEFNQGKYSKTNWKLGIPISLKDKDGKPKVNFEVLWKEINTFDSSSHLVGISANFVFGKLIN